MKVRKADGDDYKRMASIHKEAFDGFFLTSLGIGFLEAYYRSSLDNSTGINLVGLDDNDTVQGFATGSFKPKRFHRNLVLENIIPFAKALIPIVFSRPNSIIRMLRNLDKDKYNNIAGEYTELLSIGMTPNSQGNGLGRRLLEEFEKVASKKGSKRLILTTDSFNNERTLSFYQKNGYSVIEEFIAYPDRKMYRMSKNIESTT